MKAYQLRSGQALRRARWVLWMAAGIGFACVWQERALAPPVHDGMVFVAEVSGKLIEGSDETRSYIRNALTIGSGSGGSSEHNAITRWLLANRN